MLPCLNVWLDVMLKVSLLAREVVDIALAKGRGGAKGAGLGRKRLFRGF